MTSQLASQVCIHEKCKLHMSDEILYVLLFCNLRLFSLNVSNK